MKIKLNIDKKVFNDVYYPYLFDYSHKYEIWYGGSGSGKSYFIAQKILIKALNSKRRVLVVRKTMVSQKDSCWKLFLDMLSKWNLLQYCSVNKSDFSIELPNKSILLLKGLDDPERIKSIVGITDCWCEECTELNQEDFDQLTLRVRDKAPNLQFFCSFNPVSKTNWVYKRWFDENVKLTDDTLVVKTTYKDNKFLPEDYIKTLENTIRTNPTYYKIYALGEFCTLDKLVYNNWTTAHMTDFRYDELICGLDFGYVNDPSAFIAAKVNLATKEIYIFDEFYKKQLLNDAIAKLIIEKGYGKEIIFADSAEQKSIEEIRRAGVQRIRPAAKGPGSINWGINLIQQYKIYVDPSCTNTITELENYSWKKDKSTGEYTNEPNDEYNHLLDALRYGIQKIQKNRLITMSKNMF